MLLILLHLEIAPLLSKTWITHICQKASGRYAPTNKALKERARAARRWLKARPEKEIVMVTHGGFLHYFTEDWEDSSQFQGM